MSFATACLRFLSGACLLAFSAGALATGDAPLTLGKPAPKAVVSQIEHTEPVSIGKNTIRPVTAPQDARRLQSTLTPASTSTQVVRASDNLVGVSHHELSVRGADPGQIRSLVASLLPTATTEIFPDLGMAIIRTQRFSDLAPLAAQLKENLPGARFDLPIQWAPVKPR